MPSKRKSRRNSGRNNPGRNPRGHPNANRIASASEPPIRHPPLNFLNSMQRSINLRRAKKEGIMSRYATPDNIPAFMFETVAKGTPARGDADLEALREGYYSKGNMSGLHRAKELTPTILSTKPVALGPIGAQQIYSELAGTMRMINKNGSRVPIGHTEPSLSTRPSINMIHEIHEILANPYITEEDYARIHHLRRMVEIRQQRRREDDEEIDKAIHNEMMASRGLRERLGNAYGTLRNLTRTLREGVGSAAGRLFNRFSNRHTNGAQANRSRRSSSRNHLPGGSLRNEGSRRSSSRSRSPGGTRRNRRNS